ncbi:MAG: hypothetical protein DRN96_00635 [Thermoproteota archaeon]|nr:MAG: hypothetical protein DRN96_00635 [Candidatus Korarchaeota archaeon]RLG55700.1 MAG: hypothetical protein DRN99_01860 [Candidatus Korarchaeota archaeon]
MGTLEEKISAAILKNPSSLKILRKKAGVTQRELAREVNVSQSLISKIERGRTTPSPGLLSEISKIIASKLQSIEIRASDIMGDLTEVDPSDSLDKVCELLLKGKRVILGRKCITHRSLIKAAIENPETPLTAIPAIDAAEEAALVEEDEPVMRIAELLLKNEVVAVARGEIIVGIITREDVVKAIRKFMGIPAKGGI